MNQYIVGKQQKTEATTTKQEKQELKIQIPKKTKNKKEENKKKADNKKTENQYQRFWIRYAEKQKIKKTEIKNSVASENPDSGPNCGEGFDTTNVNPDKRCTRVQMAEGQTNVEREAAGIKPDIWRELNNERESSQVNLNTRPGLKSDDLMGKL